MKCKTPLLLILAVVFQIAVLIGMYVNAALPLWFGREIRVETVPVDPRSLFRGNYARLNYRFSRLEGQIVPGERRLRSGEVVYVQLKPGDRQLFEYAGLSLQKPESGVFIRGRVEHHYRSEQKESLTIKYGIEAFFAPKDKALALERELRGSGVAVLMVSDNGRAAIRDVLVRSGQSSDNNVNIE